MRIIGVYHIKGGVGKTAAAVNLAFCAARDRYRTLLCDLDPQGAASFYLRIKPPRKLSGKKLLKAQKTVSRSIRATDFDYLDLLPSDFSFRNLDLLLDQNKKSREKLEAILTPLKDDYDLIFLDCPPNITLVSENVFNASDALLIPLIPTTLSVLTFEKLVQFFQEAGLDQRKLWPFFSMVEKRKRLHQQLLNDLPGQYQQLLESQIPFSADVEKMGLFREPVGVFRPRATAAQAYRTLWQECRRRFGLK